MLLLGIGTGTMYNMSRFAISKATCKLGNVSYRYCILAAERKEFKRCIMLASVLRSRNYFFRLWLHRAANPNFASGPSPGSRQFYKIP